MPLVLTHQPGFVLAVPDPQVKGLVALEGWPGFAGAQSIITDVSYEGGENYQASQSLADLVYVTSFGRKLGSLQVAGLCLAGNCRDDALGPIGMERVLAYYEAYRMGNVANRTPATLILGSGTAIAGLLVGIRVAVSNPEARVAPFGLSFIALPAF